ncbi:MAG: NYN domain-containing protein [Pseudomonas sp.]|uniref:PIN domain-containing protein n=1 Tax=Pseudomonas sp. TaxID=306 RepID=UPI001D64CB28|nr:PIN domain-containing protein [Pseudomonas sp.]MPT00345.1 NYN domain-containing protein [Pseudomonas sp.]
MKNKKLLLVDLENKHKVDLSPLDESFKAIIFVGAHQNPPKASKKPATAHRFSRVDFLKISGAGKNALDFHIAFELGRTFETAPDTECFVLSGDKGFDPLLNHLNSNGMSCRRVESIAELVPVNVVPLVAHDQVVCPFCKKASTIEHHGGHWCSNCGRFATPPDPELLPSNQKGYREPERYSYEDATHYGMCGWCHQRTDLTGGIYDDGEWMCGGCISRYAR